MALRTPIATPSDRDRALAKIAAVEPDIDQGRLAPARRGLGLRERILHFALLSDDKAERAESRRRVMIGGAAQRHANIVAEHLDLFASDLRPAGVIADDRDDRNALADKTLE